MGAAVDIRSGQQWEELNDILTSNFESIFEFGDISKKKAVQKTFEIVPFITELITGVKILPSGSAMEGSMMDPRFRGIEADAMICPRQLIIYPTQQRDMFQYIPETPGYIRLRIPSEQKEHMLQIMEDLNKFAIHKKSDSGELFLIAKFSIDSMLENIQEKIPDNILMRVLSDSLHLDRLFASGSTQGPAANISLEGFAKPLEELSKPKDLLKQLAINICDKRISKPANEDRYEDNSNRESPSKRKCYDYMCLDNELPNALSVDCVIALECVGWPEIASGFFKRSRNWPHPITLDKIRNDCFHLVYKPLDKESADSVEWRISFSKAEAALFYSMSPPMMHCYRIFKAIFYCELTLPKVLCSYYMKTIFLWTCERLPEEVWDESCLAQVVMGLLDELVHCLVTKSCPHYFIPECNLFEHAHQDFLLDLARKVLEIRAHPDRYPKRTSKVHGGDSTQSPQSQMDTAQDIELD
ncbi:uncharacterized protein LOC5502609 [Nematostella vectensis]|uniref:uncharacterized protein LOC5502609 n=1 Tax=Nematostella vectensis TaxID=45351 RepID=UPI002076F372|nr:uncharacterized protein LOC5502609 [Nematostella vectensis]